MGLEQKVALTDEIFKEKPTSLASILVFPRMGVAMQQLDVAIHVLLVTFQARSRGAHEWPVVTGDIQEVCLQRLRAGARFNEGLPPELFVQNVQQFCDEHAGRFLLAFVYGYLGESDLCSVRTEAEKYLVLATLNLLEYIAFVGSVSAAKWLRVPAWSRWRTRTLTASAACTANNSSSTWQAPRARRRTAVGVRRAGHGCQVADRCCHTALPRPCRLRARLRRAGEPAGYERLHD